VVGATTWIGWQVAGSYSRRLRDLRALQSALAVLQTEIEFCAAPLPDALTAAGQAVGGVIGELLARTAGNLIAGGGITPGEALIDAVGEFSGTTSLKQSDWEILLALAPVLGASDRGDQVRHLRLAAQRLEAAEAQASEERQRYEKLARYAGVLTGFALVLILF